MCDVLARKLTLLLLVLLTPLAALGATAPDSPITDPQALDAILDRYVDNQQLPFIYARLEDREGNVIYEHGAVDRELLPGAVIDGDTWIRVWSMSKPVTIAIVMDLVEDGVLSLDDAVTDYIPEFSELQVATAKDGTPLLDIQDRADECPIAVEPVSNTMTVRHLVNHEAGFYYKQTGVPCLDDVYADQDVAGAKDSSDLIARLAQLPLIQQPGASYFYGLNTTVLGLVAERASGFSLKRLVEDRLTSPLQIENLRYDLVADAELLPRYSGADGVVREASTSELDLMGPSVPGFEPDHAFFLGGEGMLATADSYADFLRMLLNKGELNGQQFLEPETIAEMVAPHTQLNSEFGHNGYNIWVNNGRLYPSGYGRGGLWIVGGYEGTHGWVDTDAGLVGVVVTQIDKASGEANARHDVFREAVYDQMLAERQYTDYRLYFLGGQSNMDGYGFNEELDDNLRDPQVSAMIYRGMSVGDGNEHGGAGVWRLLGPGFGLGHYTNGYESWPSDRFGPELTFGKRLVELDPAAKIAIVKYSRGGTPLYVDGKGYGTWNPEVAGLNQYDYALRTLRDARAITDIDGDGVRDRLVPAGIIWMQGEADAFDSAAAAQAYESNLRRMMDLFRAALGVDDLPVVIGQITDSGNADDGKVMDWSDEVRAAQERYTEQDSCAALVTETNEFQYPDNDAWHYTTDGYLRMGTAFADAIVDLETHCSQ